MRNFRWMAALAVLGAAAPAQAEGEFELDGDKTVLTPITYKNLTLFPVVAKKQKKTKNYLVLDEGMKSKDVRIIEKGDGGNVNKLMIHNRSEDPLFLMAGEVIIGGKQDRIIGKNTVIAPKSKISVPVFCVEHGRWDSRKADFQTANSLAHTKLRRSASFDGQSEVWAEVSAKNSLRSEDNATDTYRRIATGKGTKTTIAGYKKHFAKKLASLGDAKKMVGFVVAVNGKVVAIEVFGSSKLFHKLEGKLLNSYYVEAVDIAVPKNKPKAPTAKAVKEFKAKGRNAKKSKVYSNAAADTVQFDNDDVQGSAVEAADADEPRVYESTYAK